MYEMEGPPGFTWLPRPAPAPEGPRLARARMTSVPSRPSFGPKASGAPGRVPRPCGSSRARRPRHRRRLAGYPARCGPSVSRPVTPSPEPRPARGLPPALRAPFGGVGDFYASNSLARKRSREVSWHRVAPDELVLWTALWRVCAPCDGRDATRAHDSVHHRVHTLWTGPWTSADGRPGMWDGCGPRPQARGAVGRSSCMATSQPPVPAQRAPVDDLPRRATTVPQQWTAADRFADRTGLAGTQARVLLAVFCGLAPDHGEGDVPA